MPEPSKPERSGPPPDGDSRPADPTRPAPPVTADAPPTDGGRIWPGWVRLRLRAAPGAAVALATLALLTSFLAAAFPRAVDTYQTDGVRNAVTSAAPERSAYQITSGPLGPQHGQSERAASLAPRKLTSQYRAIRSRLSDPVRTDPAQSSYGVRTPKALAASDGFLPRPNGLPARFTVAAQAGLGDHATLRDGRLPTAHRDGDVDAADGGRAVEAAVSAETAKKLGLSVGTRVHLRTRGGESLTLRVVGVFEPRQPKGAYWSVESLLHSPSLVPEPGGGVDPKYFWHGGLLLAPESGPALLSASGAPQTYWRLAADASELTGRDVSALRDEVASLEGGPALVALRELTGSETSLSTEMDSLLTDHATLRDAVGPIVAVAAFGVGTVAAVVLMLAAGLTAAGRRAELALLRSRGGSLTGLAGRLLAETAVAALPGCAAGCALALAVLPGDRAAPSVLAAATVAVLACVALPVRAVVAHRTVRVGGEVREDQAAGRPSRRRLVGEATLLVLAVAAVVALRRRGDAPGTVDALVSAAPVLVALIAAMLLVRLYPLPLRLAGRATARRRGLVGFLALARAGRAPSTATLPLLALLVALTTAAFGGSVLAGVHHARDDASLLAVGADARVHGTDALPEKLADTVGSVPGVREVIPAHLESDLRVSEGTSVHLVAVDPARYAALAEHTGLGKFDPSTLTAHGSGSAVPVIASPGAARQLGDTARPLRPLAGDITATVAAEVTETPAVRGGDFVIVDAARLARPRTTDLLLTGGGTDGSAIDAAALRKAARGIDGAPPSVELRSEHRARLADSPMQRGAERLYLVAVAAGAGYAALAVLLSLVQAGRERGALLSRLRAMGLTRRQGRLLLVVESLPQALLAACGGALVGYGAIRLLASGLDLTYLALSDHGGFDALGTIRLTADPISLLLPAVGVIVLTLAVVVAQSWWGSRRPENTEWRAGDTR